MLNDFKAFLQRGNVVELAVAVVIGGAFGKIVTSLVDDILMPPIGLVLGKVDFSNLFLSLSGETYASLAKAKEAGAPTINYGQFLNQVVSFLSVAFVIFLIVRQVNKITRTDAPPAPHTKECPYCYSPIALRATRCSHCTSDVKAA